ncbi:MAG: adenylate cyclase regulatory domain-containing protein, partial [Solirubrobacteraceae bacterium]
MTDWAQKGLLEGLDPQACDARARLLDELEAEGVGLDELRQAMAEDRLALLPVERELAGEARYTANELASESGLPVDFLTRQWRALGLSAADPDERIYTEADLEAARRSARFRDAGYRDESALETARVIGQAMARVADSLRLITGETMARAGDSEHDIAWRYAGAAKNMLPEVGPLLEHVLALHLRDQTRSDFISHVELESGDLRGAREVAVAFADLVGFTQLGSETPADQLGAVAGRLEEMASAVAEPPVRLVKTI